VDEPSPLYAPPTIELSGQPPPSTADAARARHVATVFFVVAPILIAIQSFIVAVLEDRLPIFTVCFLAVQLALAVGLRRSARLSVGLAVAYLGVEAVVTVVQIANNLANLPPNLPAVTPAALILPLVVKGLLAATPGLLVLVGRTSRTRINAAIALYGLRIALVIIGIVGTLLVRHRLQP
jgi:hypothetical protein